MNVTFLKSLKNFIYSTRDEKAKLNIFFRQFLLLVALDSNCCHNKFQTYFQLTLRYLKKILDMKNQMMNPQQVFDSIYKKKLKFLLLFKNVYRNFGFPILFLILELIVLLKSMVKLFLLNIVPFLIVYCTCNSWKMKIFRNLFHCH